MYDECTIIRKNFYDKIFAVCDYVIEHGFALIAKIDVFEYKNEARK
ncbi:hypothetical protein [Thomasclavelia spiroformis]|nr:hypothetical protein [Thomasclavelia spiroformis]MBS7217632.1 hypothetical protein [Thomasclavelia spiroformis]